METAAKHLLPDRVFDNADAPVASVKDVLSRWSERWLLVFDNLDNLTVALFLLPAVMLDRRSWVSQLILTAWRRRRASNSYFARRW